MQSELLSFIARPTDLRRFASGLRVNSRCISPVIAALVAVALNCASATGAPAAEKPIAESKSKADLKAGPENLLTKGMPADEVKKIMGAPAEIKPFAAPSGKAELWVYPRKTDRTTAQIEVGSKPIVVISPGADGQMHNRTIAEVPVFKTQETITEEKVELLMFNDHFLEKKLTRQISRRYD